METILACSILAAAFITLSGMHFYWALGGRRGWTLVLPTRGLSGRFAFIPSKGSTAAVGIGLLCFAIITLGATGVFTSFLGRTVFIWGIPFIGLIFLVRAIGDFKYLGLTKKVKYTDFAHYDSNYYTPFCLLVTFLTAIIFLFNIRAF